MQRILARMTAVAEWQGGSPLPHLLTLLGGATKFGPGFRCGFWLDVVEETGLKIILVGL